jgi:uncharacterized protein YeeX (DUF496 family)
MLINIQNVDMKKTSPSTKKEIVIDRDWTAQSPIHQQYMALRLIQAMKFLKKQRCNKHFMRDTKYIQKQIEKERKVIATLINYKNYLKETKFSVVKGIEELEPDVIATISYYYQDQEDYIGILDTDHVPTPEEIDHQLILDKCIPLLAKLQLTKIDAFIRQYLIRLGTNLA